MGLEGSTEANTLLYYEMYICSELLKGMPHYKFLQMPKEERLKWYHFAEMKAKKENAFHKEHKDRMDSKVQKSMPKRGVR